MPHIMPSTWTVYFHIVYPSTVFKIQFAVSSICSSLNDFRITAGILLEDASGNALPYPSLSPNQHPRLSQHHHGRPPLGTEHLRGGIHQPHLLKSGLPQILGKGLHVPVHPGLHIVIQGKYPTGL